MQLFHLHKDEFSAHFDTTFYCQPLSATVSQYHIQLDVQLDDHIMDVVELHRAGISLLK